MFNARKDVVQSQLGATVEHRLSASDSLRFAAYGGNRQVEQFLAFSGAGTLASGGVVDLDRFYYGLDLRWSRATELAGRPFAFTVGGDYDNQKERRRGYTNNNGTVGPLQRDEDDTARSAALYAEAEWKFAPRWSLLAGLRRTEVSFDSSDHYIGGLNGDDSGQLRFKNTSPVAGLAYSGSPATIAQAAARATPCPAFRGVPSTAKRAGRRSTTGSARRSSCATAIASIRPTPTPSRPLPIRW